MACWFSAQFTLSRSSLTNEMKPSLDKTVSGQNLFFVPVLLSHLLLCGRVLVLLISQCISALIGVNELQEVLPS